LRANSLRSFLTMLGIIIGVSSVIVMVALGAGAQREVDRHIEALGGNIFFLMGSWRRVSGAKTSAGSVQKLQQTHADLLQEHLDYVEAAAPVLSADVQVIRGNMNWPSRVDGIDSRYFHVRNWEVSAGRDFSSYELKTGAKVVVIGDTVRREVFGDEDPVGQMVRINRINATVVGTLRAKGQDSSGQDQDNVMLMPIKSVRSRLRGAVGAHPERVGVIYIKIADGVNLAHAERDIVDLMREVMEVSPSQEDPFMVRNLSQMVETRVVASSIFNTLLTSVAAVSLLVGGIGIMNIMLANTTERKSEIGLRRALGAKRSDIVSLFVSESLLLCVIGGAIGVAVGYGLAQLIGQLADWTVVYHTWSVPLGIIVSAVVGLIFGTVPALRAAQQDPVLALRSE